MPDRFQEQTRNPLSHDDRWQHPPQGHDRFSRLPPQTRQSYLPSIFEPTGHQVDAIGPTHLGGGEATIVEIASYGLPLRPGSGDSEDPMAQICDQFRHLTAASNVNVGVPESPTATQVLRSLGRPPSMVLPSAISYRGDPWDARNYPMAVDETMARSYFDPFATCMADDISAHISEIPNSSCLASITSCESGPGDMVMDLDPGG